MEYEPINLREKFERFTERWAPKIVARLNDYHVKLARVKGEFTWHSHPETDEAFWVLEGSLTIDFRDGSVELGEGEMFVVPRGVEHRPRAEAEAKILLVEPAGTVNTGDAGGERTAEDGVWI